MKTVCRITLVLAVGLPVFATTITVIVPGTANPWLAGMPDGSTANFVDSAPGQSPVHVTGLPLMVGFPVQFVVSGAVSNGPCCALVGPDGGGATNHFPGAENGISNGHAPINSLMGLFLDSSQPNLSAAPGTIDFGFSAAQNYLIFSPVLKQVFFIGDGQTSGGVRQQVIVPAGATRLFLGTMDGYEWNNNLGSYEVSVTHTPEPATVTLLLAGLAFLAVRRRASR